MLQQTFILLRYLCTSARKLQVSECNTS